MKMFGDYKNAAALMQPGIVTQSGFLGADMRPLPDIIQEDESLFRALDLDWEKAAAQLKYMEQEALKGLGEPVTVENKWIAQRYESRGQLPCPFGDTLLRKDLTTVSLVKDGTQIIFSALSLHLLTEHHFLQGKGSPYRIEPTLLKRILFA